MNEQASGAVNWLLSSAEPAVRTLARRDLPGQDTARGGEALDGPTVRKLTAAPDGQDPGLNGTTSDLVGAVRSEASARRAKGPRKGRSAALRRQMQEVIRQLIRDTSSAESASGITDKRIQP